MGSLHLGKTICFPLESSSGQALPLPQHTAVQIPSLSFGPATEHEMGHGQPHRGALDGSQ